MKTGKWYRHKSTNESSAHYSTQPACGSTSI